eukprot:TRINITY_DN11041_c0_g1_i4.p1 TRINITY_DN11041_c0_g1~~TRINITY_DN11041_c0_g1_i4.p1  ORF type:complete len:241 (+),score=70.13 TRINITY_DN11041_c0_g1_i4:139-861(+)
MCIRDRYQRRVRGSRADSMASWRVGVVLVLILACSSSTEPPAAEDENMVQMAPDQLSSGMTQFREQSCGQDMECSVERAYPTKRTRPRACRSCVTEQRHGAEYTYRKDSHTPGVAKKTDSEDIKRAVHGAHKALEHPPNANITKDALVWVRSQARQLVRNATLVLDKDRDPEIGDLKHAEAEFQVILDAANQTVRQLKGAIEGKSFDPERHGGTAVTPPEGFLDHSEVLQMSEQFMDVAA